MTDSTGPANYLSGDLVEIGTFSVAPAIGSPSLAGFTPFATTLTGTGNFAGSFSGSGNADAGAFSHAQIYPVVFNAPTAGAATDLAIAYLNDATNPTWRFPANTDALNTTSFDLDSLFASPGMSAALAPGATIVYGKAGFDPAGHSLLMTGIPEPSTILVATGFLGLLGFRRRN